MRFAPEKLPIIIAGVNEQQLNKNAEIFYHLGVSVFIHIFVFDVLSLEQNIKILGLPYS